MKPRTLTLLTALVAVLALPLQAADMAPLIADVAKYESGQSVEPLRKIEQLLRDSASKPALCAELEDAMAKLLASNATFEARRFACQQLAVIGTDASLPALAALLKNEETVGIACLALGSQRSPKAVETLRNALSGARGKAQVQLIIALGNHQDTQSAKSLAAMTRDADAAVACAAIVALGKIADEPSRETLAVLRKEAKPAVAWAVADASLRIAEKLAAAGDRKNASAIYEPLLQPACPANIRRGALAAQIRLDKDGGEQRILDVLRGSDAVLKPVAMAAIGTLKSGSASKKFAAELPKLQPCEQVLMIEALAIRGDAAARAAIRSGVCAADAAVRRAGIVAVGRLEGASAVPLLAKAQAGAKSPEELQDIETALVSLRGGAAADKAIVAEMKQSAGDAKIRFFGVLARRGAHTAVPALLAEIGGSDAATTQAAFQALGKLAGAGDLPAMLERLVGLSVADTRPDAESAVSRVMQKIANPAQRTDLVMARMAKCSDIEGRCSLLRVLPNAGGAKALAALKAAGADKDPAIRDAAVRALAAWPDIAAWDALLAVCRKPENETLRTLAFRGMVRLAGDLNAKPDAALIERYRVLLAVSGGPDDRKLLLGALGGVAHPGALEIVLPLLSRVSIRPEAELAVRKIAAAIKGQNPEAAREALLRLQTPPPAKPAAAKPAVKRK